MRLIDLEMVTLTSFVTIWLLEYFFKRKERIAREEYDKLEALAQQYKFERDVLEESQQNKVEVGRCKGCWIWTDDNVDDFCSYGERKKDDD